MLFFSFFSQARDVFPSWFPGSFWFRLGFRGLSPDFFSPSGQGFCSVLIPQTALELNGVLISCQKRSLFHHDLLFLLVPARVPVLVSLLLSSSFSRKGVLFHHDVLALRGSGSGSGACLPFFSLRSFLWKGVLFHHGPGSSWFRLGFRCLSLFFSLLPFPGKGFCPIMMCWFLLVPARVPVLVSLSSLFFLFSGKGFCSIMVSWLFVVPARVPVLVSLSSLFFLLSGKGFCSIMMSWLFVVPALVPVLVSLLLSSILSQEMEFVPSWSWFLLVPARVPVLVSFCFLLALLRSDFVVFLGSGWGSGACLSSFFLSSRNRVVFHHDFLVSPRSGSGSGAYVPSSPFFSFSQENGFVPPRLHGSVSTQGSCVPFSISSLTNEFRNEQ